MFVVRWDKHRSLQSKRQKFFIWTAAPVCRPVPSLSRVSPTLLTHTPSVQSRRLEAFTLIASRRLGAESLTVAWQVSQTRDKNYYVPLSLRTNPSPPPTSPSPPSWQATSCRPWSASCYEVCARGRWGTRNTLQSGETNYTLKNFFLCPLLMSQT